MNAADLQKLSLSFPGATETIQWDDDRVFKAAGKMFAVSGMGADSAYCFKVDDERFLEMTDLPGIRPAPYLARAKWVQVDSKICELPSADLKELVQRSYDLVVAKLPKKTQKSLIDEG